MDNTITEQPRAGLRRSLSVWQAVGLSIALMAPSMAANINPQGSSQYVGRAVPLAFVIATVGVLLVAYVFVRLCQHYNHAGSVYGFVGATLGPRSGVVAGWSLLGTYCFYGVVTANACGIFGTTFLQEIHVWKNPPDWGPFIITAAALLLVFYLAIAPARNGTRVLLSVEGMTVALILVVTVAVLIRLLAGTAPGNHKFTLNVFTVPSGTSPSVLFLGVIFAFLSFAGFEAAATLGEEAHEPRRDIPRAILGTAIFGGIYFTVVTAVEVMGFGSDSAGVAAFTKSGSLLGDLGRQYVGVWVGDIITLGAAISGFGCALACAVGASRLLFALGRDGVAPRPVARISPRFGTPTVATSVVVGLMYAIVLIDAVAFNAKPFDEFSWSGTIGTLILLIVYLAATVGAIRLLFFSGRQLVRRWEATIPAAAIVLLGYTVYRNVVPYPSGPAYWFPIVAGIWIVSGIAFVLAAPGLSARAGRQLTADEGLR